MAVRRVAWGIARGEDGVWSGMRRAWPSSGAGGGFCVGCALVALPVFVDFSKKAGVLGGEDSARVRTERAKLS